MAQVLIGRESEKAKIDKILASPQAEFLALYGRRRVGKTFLIREYLKDHLVFDLSGSRDGLKEQQIANFYGQYLRRTNNTGKTNMPTNWYQAFEYLADYLIGLPPTNTKHVVFLDEMPWMDTPKSDFIAALDFFWNQYGSKLDNLLLIACGSASSWILKNLINARGGLYNRVTRRIRLAPFNLCETEQFIKTLGLQMPHYQILELYMVMGGIPFYLKEIERGKSTIQLIDEICFSPQGLLYEEYSQLYHSLFRNAEHHIAIVEALASRPQGMVRTDLAVATKISEGQLTKVLQELVECDFIGYFPPFTNKKKDGIYKLIDLYSLFYLKFIKQEKGSGANAKIWEKISKTPQFAAWSGYAFENICMAHIQQIKNALGISGVYTRHNSWKHKATDELPGAQIDMVIERADSIIHLCEAKFTRENFVLTGEYTEKLRLRKSIFKQVTKTKKLLFNTLLTTYPAIQNKYYFEEIESEVTMDKLFL